jgi:hypothetical protein
MRARPVRIAAIERDRRQPELGVWVKLDLAKQGVGFVQSALPAAELGQAHDHLKSQSGPDVIQLTHRCVKLHLGLSPRPARDQHPGVMRTAHGEEMWDAPALGVLEHSLTPLICAVEVADPLTRGDYVTAGPANGPQF